MCLPACQQYLACWMSRHSFWPGSLGVVATSPGGGAPAAGAALSVPITSARRVADLTHTLDPDFPTFGGDAQVAVRTVSTLAADGWNMREWQFNEHTGTHLDAPLHRTPGGKSVDALPVEALIGPLAVIDLRARAERDPDTTLTPADVQGWEARHGRLPDGAIVALCSGWGAHARSATFRGADAAGRLHFPGFHEETAAWLLEARRIAGIAVDTLSLDPGISTAFPVHTRWLGSGRWGLECVARIETVPPSGATLVVGAPKLAGGTGGPSRVMALW